MTTRYYVETRNPPPDHDCLSLTEHSGRWARKEAFELARRVNGRVWVQQIEGVRTMLAEWVVFGDDEPQEDGEAG